MKKRSHFKIEQFSRTTSPLAMSGLLAVLQTDLVALLLKYLCDSHGVLLEIAKPIRSSPTFAWEASTQTAFTLHKVAEHLRTDSLCRRAISSYMGAMRLHNFVHMWAGVPSEVLRPGFVAFIKTHFDMHTSRIRTNFEEEMEELGGYEDYLRDHCRILAREQYPGDQGISRELNALMIYSRWGSPQVLERKLAVLSRCKNATTKSQKAYVHVLGSL